VIDPRRRERIEVVVPDTNNQAVCGGDRPARPEQNVRLARNDRLGHRDILTEQEEGGKRKERIRTPSRRLRKFHPLFMEALNLKFDDVVGQLLASEGFTSWKNCAMVDVREWPASKAFDDETRDRVAERNSAKEYLDQIEDRTRKQTKKENSARGVIDLKTECGRDLEKCW